jgi:hypothetical protein
MAITNLIRWLFGFFVLAILVIVAFVAFAIASQNMSELVSYTDRGGNKILHKTLRYYLWHFRGSPEDLRELEFNGGAELLLSALIKIFPK